jgi:hypothetical protein
MERRLGEPGPIQMVGPAATGHKRETSYNARAVNNHSKEFAK